jgi:hypothetical protein
MSMCRGLLHSRSPMSYVRAMSTLASTPLRSLAWRTNRFIRRSGLRAIPASSLARSSSLPTRFNSPMPHSARTQRSRPFWQFKSNSRRPTLLSPPPSTGTGSASPYPIAGAGTIPIPYMPLFKSIPRDASTLGKTINNRFKVTNSFCAPVAAAPAYMFRTRHIFRCTPESSAEPSASPAAGAPVIWALKPRHAASKRAGYLRSSSTVGQVRSWPKPKAASGIHGKCLLHCSRSATPISETPYLHHVRMERTPLPLRAHVVSSQYLRPQHPLIQPSSTSPMHSRDQSVGALKSTPPRCYTNSSACVAGDILRSAATMLQKRHRILCA